MLGGREIAAEVAEGRGEETEKKINNEKGARGGLSANAQCCQPGRNAGKVKDGCMNKPTREIRRKDGRLIDPAVPTTH
jgi:hypothetical protein